MIDAITARLQNSLYRNSLYLLGATGASALSGFIFWMIAARLAESDIIGVTSSALAAVVLLKSVTDFGLSLAVIHFIPRMRMRTPLVYVVNTVVAVTWILGTLTSVVFVLGIPIWSPTLLVFRTDALLFFALVAFTAFDAVLAIQDAVMLAQKNARYVFLRNLACNLPPVLLILVFASLSASVHALFLAYTVPNFVMGVGIGTYLLPRQIPGYRFWGKIRMNILRLMVAYGLPNHTSNLLWSLPAYLLPLIVTNILTPEQLGYFMINWTVTNILLMVPRAATLSMFVEGSHDKSKLWQLAGHTLRAILAMLAMPIVVLWLVGAPLVGFAFGPDYGQAELLRYLSISVVPFAINSIYFIILRVRGQIFMINAFAGLTATSAILLTMLFGTSENIASPAMGWMFGQSLPAVMVLGLLLWHWLRYLRRAKEQPAHAMSSS